MTRDIVDSIRPAEAGPRHDPAGEPEGGAWVPSEEFKARLRAIKRVADSQPEHVRRELNALFKPTP